MNCPVCGKPSIGGHVCRAEAKPRRDRVFEAAARRGAAIDRALELLADDNLDQGDGMSLDTMMSAIRQAREILELAK